MNSSFCRANQHNLVIPIPGTYISPQNHSGTLRLIQLLKPFNHLLALSIYYTYFYELYVVSCPRVVAQSGAALQVHCMFLLQ